MSANVLYGLGSVATAVRNPIISLGDAATGVPVIQQGVMPDNADPAMIAPTPYAAQYEYSKVAAQLAGHALAGSIIGGIAASSWRGAGMGALATAGLAALGGGLQGFMSPIDSASKNRAAAISIVGLAATATAIYFAAFSKGRK